MRKKHERGTKLPPETKATSQLPDIDHAKTSEASDSFISAQLELLKPCTIRVPKPRCLVRTMSTVRAENQ